MAGDWIKVEVATLDKPEVMRMAELLGIKRDEAIGLLVRFWTWLDRATGNGLVTHTSRKGIDEVMHCPGFAGAFEAIGWGKFDDTAVTMEVVNYSRHNGNPAKTRALGKDRKREHDERKRNANPVTREEKRRDIKEREIAGPTDEHRQLAKALAINVDDEWQKYTDHQRNAKHRHTDLQAGFRNWIRRAHEFRPAVRPVVSAKQDARGRVADAMWGKDERPAERVIDGEAKRVA